MLEALRMIPVQIVAALITGSVATAAFYLNYRNRVSDRMKVTRDLYNQFFTLADSRTAAWFWLEELNREQNPRYFEQLWRVEDKDQTAFMRLYKVLAFWFLVYTLFRANQLDRSLARSVFRYEFEHWQVQVGPLAKRTRAMNVKFAEVLLPFESTDWLLKE